MAANSFAYQFKNSSIVVKLIAINAAIFLVVNLTSFFFSVSPAYLTRWFVLPNDFGSLLLQPWSLVTYAFLHFGFWHILFNMLWLYWIGNFILNLFPAKRFLTIYLLGAIFGGLLYIIAYNLFPVFAGRTAYLIGASGAVMAIMAFIATYTPNTQMRIFFFTVKLWHVAVFFFLLDIIRLPTSGNEGGLLAHIGGAIFGYLYAQQLAKGNDIGKWFEDLIDGIGNIFKSRSKKPFRKVHRTTRPKTKRSNSNTTKESKTDNQKKIDIILDKIGKSGYESLTKAEKDFLFKAGKED